MSRIQELLPEELIEKIKSYLKQNCLNNISSTYRRNQSDEDSVTSSFFENLSKESEIEKIGSNLWKWSIEYSTTSSRGKKPLETVLGADVILFIEIKLPNGTIFRKGILVQSKIEKNMSRNKLEDQINQMENFVEGSSVILTYNSSSYRSTTGEKYLRNKGNKWKNYSNSFCEFLADQFMECQYGIIDLYYDFNKREATYLDRANNRILFIPERGVAEIKIRELD